MTWIELGAATLLAIGSGLVVWTLLYADRAFAPQQTNAPAENEPFADRRAA